MPDLIRAASTPEDFAAFGALVTEYTVWLRARYADDTAFIDRVLSHQSLDLELRALPMAYAAPKGHAQLARSGVDGAVLGGAAYRRLDDRVCEMKRVFVRQSASGRGIGRRLCLTLIDAARADGYALMRLDTGQRMVEAIALYESLGFRRCPPYLDYPPTIAAEMLYFERRLA